MIPANIAITDPQWEAFQAAAAERRVLPGSSVDWRDAWHAWRVLDGFQKQAAIEDVRTRPLDRMELTHSTPASYLRKRVWERPLPRQAAEKPRSVMEGALARLRKGGA